MNLDLINRKLEEYYRNSTPDQVVRELETIGVEFTSTPEITFEPIKLNGMKKKIKYTSVKQIDIFDWNDLVKEVYSKPYNLQQQDDCYGNGENVEIDIDLKNPYEDMYEGVTNIPLKVNGEERGVSFNTWLETDPETFGLSEWKYDYEKGLFWDRNFYPDVNYLAQDLCKKGYIEEGSYTIKIWW